MRSTVMCLILPAIRRAGLARRQAWLSGVLGRMVALSPAGRAFLTPRFAATLRVLAAANEAVWRIVSKDVWLACDSFAMPAWVFGYLALTIRRA